MVISEYVKNMIQKQEALTICTPDLDLLLQACEYIDHVASTIGIQKFKVQINDNQEIEISILTPMLQLRKNRYPLLLAFRSAKAVEFTGMPDDRVCTKMIYGSVWG